MAARIAVVISDEFLRRLMPTLATLAQQGTELRIIDVHRPFARIRSLLDHGRPDGIITEWLPGTTAKLLKLGHPTVIADTDFVYPGALSIDIDDHAVGTGAADYFLDAGYRHFAFVGVDRPYSHQRLAGFRERLSQADADCAVHQESEPANRHYIEIWQEPPAALCKWLRELPKPAAVFAAHDPLGRLVCEAAREAGVSIPDEIAVLGANNDELVCALSHPPLSSIVLPWDRIGNAIGDWIHTLGRRSRRPSKPILFHPGGVVQRQSTTLLAVDHIPLRRALQYLRIHLAEPFSIGGMCRDLHLSRRSVERSFSEHLHTTPLELLHRMRVDQAKTLLVSTNQPITLIAEHCGFSSGERFATVFRQWMKTSPSKYRKSARPARP